SQIRERLVLRIHYRQRAAVELSRVREPLCGCGGDAPASHDAEPVLASVCGQRLLRLCDAVFCGQLHLGSSRTGSYAAWTHPRFLLRSRTHDVCTFAVVGEVEAGCGCVHEVEQPLAAVLPRRTNYQLFSAAALEPTCVHARGICCSGTCRFAREVLRLLTLAH